MRLTLGISGANTPYSSSEPNKSIIVNRQCGGEKLKYVPKYCIGVQVTWYRACAVTICTGQAVWNRISQKRLEVHTWSQWSTNRKCGMGSRMVTWPVMWPMTSRDFERKVVAPLLLVPNIFKKGRPVAVEAWYHRTTNGKLPMSSGMVTLLKWPLTSRDLANVK